MLKQIRIATVMLGSLAAAQGQPLEIKMGTLAPQGSPWHKVLERYEAV